MKTFRFIIAAVATLSLASCVQKINPEHSRPDDALEGIKISFRAGFDTKTSIDGPAVSWNEGDSIRIYCTNSSGELIGVTALADKAGESTTFTATVPEADFYYAVHPADAGVRLDGEVDTMFVSIPVQNGTFDKANVCVAKTSKEKSSFAFKNICPIVKFETTKTVRRVEIIDNSYSGIKAGICAAFDGNGNVEASPRVTSQSHQGADIADGFTGPYYLAVLPRSYSDGISVRLISVSSEENIPDVINEKAISLSRKDILNFGNIDSRISVDRYVSPSGSGDGMTKDSPMSFGEFLAELGYVAPEGGKYDLKIMKIAGHKYHFAPGTYTFSAGISTYFSGPHGDYGTTGVPFELVGEDPSATVFDGGNTTQMFYFNSFARVTVRNITFQNGICSAEGGAIRIATKKGARFINCVFKNNSAGTYAGAVAVVNGLGIFENCHFEGNKSTTNAGAVRLNGGTLKVDGCTFLNNEATGSGTGAKAGTGGAIYIGTNDAVATILNTRFEGNYAKTSGRGGAINFQAAETTTIIDNCDFIGNHADVHSGAFDCAGAGPVITVTNSRFKGNYAPDDSGSTGYGGVAYLTLGDTKLSNCVFEDNYAHKGGAFYVGTGKAMFNNCVFIGNYSVKAGQANCIYSSSAEYGFTALNNCTLTTRASADIKGTYDIWAVSTCYLSNCTIVNTTGVAAHSILYSTAANDNRFVSVNNVIKDNSGNSVSYKSGSYVVSLGATMFNGGAFSTGSDTDASAPEALTASADGSYYMWNGVTGFKRLSASAVRSALVGAAKGGKVSDDVKEGYLKWLDDQGGFNKDITGAGRNESGVCPGSYEIK